MHSQRKKKSQVESAYQILCERIKQMRVGESLPPFAALIRELSFSQATLSRAYDRLESEGLITRRNRLGVYVSDPKASGEMAVVMQGERLREGSSPYYRNVMAGINHALGALDAAWQLRVHVGQPVQELEDFPATLDLDSPDLRGVFTFEPLFEMEAALAERGVPIVGILPRPGRCWVGYDRDDYIVRSMEYLGTRGCCSIGTIGARSLKRSRLIGLTSNVGDKVAQAAARAGIELRPEWVLITEGVPTEALGYDLFCKLWNMDPRPEALLVPDDVVCGGVLRAILQLGVEMPRDIRLVTFANKNVPLPYHQSVTRFELDPDAVADAAVTMMNDLLYGRLKQPEERLVKGEFIQGCTA